MNRCANDGYLVNATAPLPTDPTDFHLDALPTVGCSRIRCQRCEALVRSVAGRGLRSPADLAPARLAELYAIEDLAGSSALQPIDPEHRLYLCRCSRWVETSEHACKEPELDPLTDPELPWACAGHPRIALPHDLDGAPIGTQAELHELVLEGFRGFAPPHTRPADRERGDWLVRLHARLEPADAAVVVRAARACLGAPIPRARALALRFFRLVPDPAALGLVLDLLAGDRRLLAGVPDEVTPFPQFDRALEDTAWRVVGPLVATPGPARDLARADVIAGRGSRAVFSALAAHDPDWLLASLEPIVHAAPDRAKDLSDSLAALPAGAPRKVARDRITQALATPAPAPVTPAADAAPTGFDAALATPGPLVAAWDMQSDNDDELRIYAVGPAGARLLAEAVVPVASREALHEDLRGRGLRIGAAYPYSGHVWVFDEAGFAVWNATAQLVDGTAEVLRLRDGSVPVREVTEVTTFLDPADAGHRGVRCTVEGGRSLVVVEEFDPAPHQLPFYDTDALEDDVRWAVHVGFALAMWLRVRHVDHNGRLTNESTLQVAIATHALAAEVARLPAAGAFTQLTRAVGSFGRVHGLTLQVAPVAGSPDLRVLEAEASLPDGARAPGGAVKLGTTAQLASYLRRYQTPYRLLRQLADPLGQLTRRS